MGKFKGIFGPGLIQTHAHTTHTGSLIRIPLLVGFESACFYVYANFNFYDGVCTCLI